MAYYHDFPYPPYYVPEPWRTTHVPRHFPERHFPLEHFRHTVGHTLGSVADTFIHPWGPEQPMHNPSIDVRESKKSYYIDIELPGLDNKAKLRIKWSSSKTLLVEAELERPKVDEEAQDGEATASTTTATEPTPGDGQSASGDANVEGKDHEKDKDIALTVHERRVGTFARAFSFPIKVNHEELEAHLHAGLLRVKVPKVETYEVKPEHKEVEVKHSGA